LQCCHSNHHIVPQFPKFEAWIIIGRYVAGVEMQSQHYAVNMTFVGHFDVSSEAKQLICHEA